MPSDPPVRRNGFALVISLSLMVLLTVLAVGLLSLSSLSLATSSREADLGEARANARLALQLAISQLQKTTGPDQRVTTTADQLSASQDGGETSAGDGRRHWAGVYRSWPSTVKTRPAPEFISWLVSGQEDDVAKVTTAESSASGGETIDLVGEGTVGKSPTGRVKVPALTVDSFSGGAAKLGWWTGDQGTKAAMATPPPSTDMSLAMVRAGSQAAPRNAVELAKAGASKPFGSLKADDERTALVTDWQQSAFLASDIESPRELFHDIAPFSTGLLTNVRLGGFRKDLSMQMERPITNAASTALYTVSNEPGINLQELRTYYNLYKEVKSTGGPNFTTGGGRIGAKTPFLQVDGSPSACQNDEEFYYKQPAIISYQMVLSFQTRPLSVTENGQTRTINALHVVSDPIITFWNPLDVPVAVPIGSYISVKYWQIPYDMFISVGGVIRQCPLIRSFSAGDSNYLSLVAGKNQQLVFKPGEVIKVSQSGNLIVKTGPGTDHNLAATAGFNYGGGVSYPVRDVSGKNIEITPAATVTYEVKANGYTSGQTSSSGLVPSGYIQHTRHFSLTHHEVYVGDDRGSNSLGYGAMCIDWDFGNKRLKPNETRGESQPGTKPSGQRLYANKHADVFKPISKSDGRPLSASELAASKSPFMIVSYNAKTEAGTDPAARTRFLGRFNPKAHHVDYYDLSQAERDMLPYEYTVEPLVSWKNRSLETSPKGQAYFGGGMNAQLGTSYVTTHSVPREPIVSLAAFQHSFANGFEIQKPKYGYAALNAREPLLPQISHAIGNSVAPPILTSDKTEGSIAGGRPVADHSYLANLGLWDDWFFSGIAPQTMTNFGTKRAQRAVADEFLKGTGKLPVVRYMADTEGVDANTALTSMFSGSTPTDAAIRTAASLIRVDGLFNVNSTSVEAWKAMLGSLKGRQVVVRDASGSETLGADDGNAPVANLHGPMNVVSKGDADVADPDQWVGRRTLTEDEIDALARAIVKEVRRRGPFLSLADFVNRRVGTDKDLARAGAIQCALDSEDVPINSGYLAGGRAVEGGVANRFKFPEAEQGALAYGMPGVVKQADILTPIAPVLSARSDSFIIRAYGESVDKKGKVLARAWCEATVERKKQFVDESDKPETAIASLQSEVNKTFGRRYEMTSFRWLHPDEV